jgi:hypothetical protein
MNIENINYIKYKIEEMDKKNHIEILKIFKKYKNIVLNENKNGIFINISELDNDIIVELDKYIKYIDIQKQILEKDEKEKYLLENKYFKSS